MDPVKLARLQAQASNRIGGKGTVRRKVVKKTKASTAHDDKKLQGALKKLNVQPIPGVEEVNMFREDGNVLHFTAPKVHASVPANTFAIYGAGSVKELTELVPGILNQLGPDSLASLRKLAESYQTLQGNRTAPGGGTGEGDDDDEVPDLVDNFDVEDQQPSKGGELEELN
ncbi:EGD1 [Sanghuangporus baumii]